MVLSSLRTLHMWLVVGLGNPGSEYSKTRHNIGFKVVDGLAHHLKVLNWSHKFKGEFSKINFESHEVILLKPQTYMNLSGESVQPFLQYFKIPLSHLIVVHDELDIDFGKIKIQKNRGPGGHNGLRSIQQLLATQDFLRVKMGVGKPARLEGQPNMNIADYVLSSFSKDEHLKLDEFIESGVQALETILLKGADKAANVYNAK